MKTELNPAYSRLKAFVEDIPQIFESGGTVLYNERNIIKQFSVADDDVVVKRFKRPNVFQKLIYTFLRHSKAQRAYLNAKELINRGERTPVNIAYIETYRHGLLEYCYYVTTVDDAPPIAQRLNDIESFDTVLAADFASFAARLHGKGILHDDLNSTNVLYHSLGDGHYDFSMIDINRMRFYADNTYPPLSECMENMTRFTGRMDLFGYVAERYSEARALDIKEQMIATKESHDKAWRRRKKILHLFK